MRRTNTLRLAVSGDWGVMRDQNLHFGGNQTVHGVTIVLGLLWIKIF